MVRGSNQQRENIGWQEHDQLFEYPGDAEQAANQWISQKIATDFDYNFSEPIKSFRNFTGEYLGKSRNRDDVYEGSLTFDFGRRRHTPEVQISISAFPDDHGGPNLGYTFTITEPLDNGKANTTTIVFRLDHSKGGPAERNNPNFAGSYDIRVAISINGTKSTETKHLGFRPYNLERLQQDTPTDQQYLLDEDAGKKRTTQVNQIQNYE